MIKLIVTNQPELLPDDLPGVEIITPREYFTEVKYASQKNTRVFNLMSNYGYQSKGYYVSLLAEARGHKPIPDVKNLQDIRTGSIIRSMTDDLDSLIQRSLRNIRTNEFYLSVYFGKNLSKQYEKLAAEFHKIFPVPLFRVKLVKTSRWMVHSIKTIGFNELPEPHRPFMKEAAGEYFDRKRFYQSKGEVSRFDLAILVQPDEASPPSDKRALAKFKEAAERSGYFVEFITKDDFARLTEFDALFIRATTKVNHYTYRMARKAESEGMAVIDDPSSILKCANKVYLAEALRLAKIPTPKTMIIHNENRRDVVANLGLPCILKLPDSSFSLGVVKVNSEEELNQRMKAMFEETELIIGQAYAPTEFDWRIGVLNGKALYACKYYMARGHWQIYNWAGKAKKDIEGGYETVALDSVPEAVRYCAERAASLIGNGLYGVDLKEIDGHPLVIEVNDNPNVDCGVEDKLIGDRLYDEIIGALTSQLMKRLQQNSDKNG